jgi:DNA-binding transcriptional LysR family regulator
MSLLAINLRHIRSFLAVARVSSFAQAAVDLGISQPALSQTIIQLERTVGFELFHRTTRSVALTVNGEILLERAKALAESMDAFHAEVRLLRQSISTEIRLGYLIGTGVEYLPEILKVFEKKRPEARVSLLEFDFNRPDAGLADNTVDCAVIRPPIDVGGISITTLATERCVVCLPEGHPLTRFDSLKVEQILDESFIAAPKPGVWRDYWLAGDHRAASPPRVVFEAATVDSELQAVATRKGISITAESTAKYYARPGIEFRTLVDMPHCSIAIASRTQTYPLVRDLILTAKEVTGQSR